MQPISRQRIGKHVPIATNTNKTMELMLETVFPTRSVQSGYKEDNWGSPVSIDWELSSAGRLWEIEPERMELNNLHC
jgi:hypothetical protein